MQKSCKLVGKLLFSHLLFNKTPFMKKFYAALLCLFSSTMIFAQCPILRGAFVNSCAPGGNDEGLNELIVFKTTVTAQVQNYVLSYGAANPPVGGTPAPTGVLSGANARTANGSGSISHSLGCNVVYVTTPTTSIPANSYVVFIPSNFTNNFDVSSFCQLGASAYVAFIDITATPSKWTTNGVLVNSPGTGVFRYMQIENSTSACAANVRSYTGGWASNADGNFVAWDDAGVATYSNLGCDLITLPVTLHSFNAVGAGKNANITWQTAAEFNSGSFELQRSSDGSSFDAVATIDAAGHSSTLNSYSYTDVNIPATSYYRLKIIDKDGKISYSQVVKVSNATGKFVITNTYPKPATSQLTITWNSPAAGKTIASVYDYTGKLLMSQELSTLTGMNNAQLQVSKLPRGQYLLKLSKDNDIKVTRFTK